MGREGGIEGMESIWIATPTYTGGWNGIAGVDCILQQGASVMHAELQVLYESMHCPDPNGLQDSSGCELVTPTQ